MNFVVLEADPAPEALPYMVSAVKEGGFVLLDNREVISRAGDDPEARAKLNSFKHIADPSIMTVHYRKALLELAGPNGKVALYGSRWMEFVPKLDAVVVDLGPFAALRKNPEIPHKKFTREQVLASYDGAYRVLMERIKTAGGHRVLELAAETPEVQKRAELVALLLLFR